MATFYSQFRLNPKEVSHQHLSGTACYVKGAAKVLEAVARKLGIQVGECTPDGLFSLESCRCVGACGLAPVMMINDEVFGRMTPEQVLESGGLCQKGRCARMITTKELNHIRETGRQLVAVRNAVTEQSERLEQQTAYRKQVLVCGGTGCTSSGSKKVIAALRRSPPGGEAGEGASWSSRRAASACAPWAPL